MKPKVSIIVATYNRAKFLVEMLVSIQNQTFVDWECIIVDDGSTDNSLEIIGDYIKKDNRFHLFSRPKCRLKGPSACRNVGIEKSKGEYVVFFDDDDIAHPQNLELCLLELSKKDVFFCRYIRNVFFVSFDYSFDYSKVYKSFYIDSKDIERVLKNELFIVTSSIMWNKKCFENNRFVENLTYFEERELYSRILSSGFSGVSIEKCLYYGRKHANSLTGEYFRNIGIRRASHSEAILLVLQNLKEKQLLTYSLKRYFIAFSIDFEEYHLFENILNVLELSIFEKLKWQLFYAVLPLRLILYRMRKTIKKKV